MINEELITILLDAPDSQLDKCTFPLIEQWRLHVDSLDILYVLDICAYAALASGFMMRFLSVVLDKHLEAEGSNYNEAAKKANEIWRKSNGPCKIAYLENRLQRIQQSSRN